MIAAHQVAPEIVRVERIRHATLRRTRRTRRRMHKPVLAVLTLAIAMFLPLLGYVALTSNLTSLNYALARADRDRTALVEESQRLDDRIARLKSPDRLAAVATGLKMHDPQVYAVVTLPETTVQPRPTGLAFFSGWFTNRTADPGH
ncbi:MAG: hypothetical protein ABI186_03560 [Candidatus Elarobacter sp.]